jgi:hypothetical protein
MSARLRHSLAGEQGSIMVITLAFLSFAGLLVVALLNYSAASLGAANRLANLRGTDYDADGAIEAAIASIRTTPPYQGYVGQCDFYRPSIATLNNASVPLKVECLPKLAPPFQRDVLFSVCPDPDPTDPTPEPCSDSETLLRANVKFYDDRSFGREVAIDTWSTAP